MDLRHAAQAVGVLHLVAVAVRLADLAVREQAPQVPGGGRLAGVRPGGLDARVERDVGALERLEGQGADDVGERASRRASATARAPTAVMSCVPLMRERPSFGSSTSGARPAARLGLGAGDAASVVHRLALADEDQGEVGERREVPLAPTEPCEGTTGWTPRFSRSTGAPGSRADPGEALGEHVRAQENQRARLLRAERGADARGVRADQVELQLAQSVEGDVHVGEVAEAGGHPVDHRAARHRLVDDAPGGPDGVARGRGEEDRAAGAGDRLEAARSRRPPSIGRGAGRGLMPGRRSLAPGPPCRPGAPA